MWISPSRRVQRPKVGTCRCNVQGPCVLSYLGLTTEVDSSPQGTRRWQERLITLVGTAVVAALIALVLWLLGWLDGDIAVVFGVGMVISAYISGYVQPYAARWGARLRAGRRRE